MNKLLTLHYLYVVYVNFKNSVGKSHFRCVISITKSQLLSVCQSVRPSVCPLLGKAEMEC